MKIVTSYSEPDLDGTACMFAYSELLNKLGEEANYAIWNKPKQEVEIVCNIFKIKLKGLEIEKIPKNSKVVLVDLNGREQVHNNIDSEDIVEIIDHHGLSKWLQTYTNLERMQIDRIAAAATIVTERYRLANIVPSRESAILLFYGIISNSINLKSSLTSNRDREACKWLKSICDEISEEKIKEIFIKKSYIEDKNLRSEMECEIANTFKDFKTIIGQLEVANIEEFLKEKKQKVLKIMKEIKEEKQVDYIFINCVDILNGFIIVIGLDEESRDFVKKIYGYEFDENGEAKINKIIQRKEMTKILRKKML